MKIVLVTNIPAPYRLPIYERIARQYGSNFLVIYAAENESNRSWDLNTFAFNHLFLKENVTAKKDGFNYVHNNPDIWNHLKRFNPDVIITTGFNPTHLYAWFFSVLFRKKHIPMTDGWSESEKHLSFIHKWVRKIVYKTSDAFIGASKNSMDLFRSYGVPDQRIFQSHLCIDNLRFDNQKSFDERPYHLMFSGQFTERKLPFFFAEIAQKIAKKIPNLKVLILGNGPLKDEFFGLLKRYHIDFHYAGFVAQEKLPDYYSDAKLFLFPTLLDPWGVVANEAMASGTPVITTPQAGIIDDLLIDQQTGYILPIDSDIWSETVISLLNSSSVWNQLSSNAKRHVQDYNFDAASRGIIDAAEYAYEI